MNVEAEGARSSTQEESSEPMSSSSRRKVLWSFLVLAILLVGLGVWGLFSSENESRTEADRATGRAREEAARHETIRAAMDWARADDEQAETRRIVADLTRRLRDLEQAEEVESAEKRSLERALQDAEARQARAAVDLARADREAHRAQILYDIEISKRAEAVDETAPDERLAPKILSAAKRTNDSKHLWLLRDQRAAELEFWLDDTSSARRNARHAANAAKVRYREDLDGLEALTNEVSARAEPPAGRLFDPAVRFLARALRGAAPAFLLLGILIPLALLAGLIPWVRDRLKEIWKALVSERPPKDGESPIQTLARQRHGSFGGFVLRAGAAGTAVALAIGAFTVTVPGRSIDLYPGEPEVSEVGLRVGDYGVSIPGREVPIALGEPEQAESEFTIDPIKIRIPGKEIDVPEENVHVFTNGVQVDRPEIVFNPPDIRVVIDDPRGEDLEARMGELMNEVGQLRSQVSVLDGQLAVANRTLATVETASSRLVVEAQDSINGVNRKPGNALFRQTRIRNNCTRFCGLANVFPGIAQTSCDSPGRFAPFRPWGTAGTTDCPRIPAPLPIDEQRGDEPTAGGSR